MENDYGRLKTQPAYPPLNTRAAADRASTRKAERIKTWSFNRLPRQAIIRGVVSSRRTNSNQCWCLHARHIRHYRTIPGETLRECPALATVVRHGEIILRGRLLSVVTPDYHAVFLVAECKRKDTGRFTGDQRRLRNLPRATAVGSTQHASLSCRTCADPGVCFPKESDVGPTRRKGTFIFEGRRQ